MLETLTTAMTHLDILATDIGARPAGTPPHHQTEAYIRNVFEAHKLTVEDVTLPFPNWDCQAATLHMNDLSLVLDVNPFSPACDITAPLVAVSTLPQLEALDIQGKVVLLYGELSKAPIFPMNFELVQFERDQTINRLLMDKAPAVVLAVNLHPWRRMHIFEDEYFPIPSATVSVDVGRTLLNNLGADVHIHIATTTQPSHVTTLVGRTPPQHQQRIVLCAHYDTKIGTPGAFDNGAGMATLLALVERLQHETLAVDIEFVAWADEEYGAHTDSAYTERFGDSFEDILCAINIDGIGLLTENTTLTALAHSPELEQTLRHVQAQYTGVVWVDPWVQSNHSTYAMRGVPSIALSSLTWERAHQHDDDMSWISAEKLDETLNLVTDIVRTIQQQPASWSRP